MISFRYHLVSLVAVFFALAIGVLVGTTVLNQGVIDDLNRRTDAAEARADNLRAELERVDAELSTLRDLTGDIEPLVVADKLLSRQVVVVTADGVNPAAVSGVRTALEQSGADIQGVVILTQRMALATDSDRTELAEGIGVASTDDPEELASAAGGALGGRLARGFDGVEPDLLSALASAGFLSIQVQPDTSLMGGPGQSVVVLAGDDEPAVLDPSGVFVPMLRTLAVAGIPSLAGETTDTVYPFVTTVREDQLLSARVVTVDNAETMPGRVAAVVGLRDLLEGAGASHYGVKPGSSGLLPRA